MRDDTARRAVPSAPARSRRSRWPLVAIAALCLAPFAASLVFYYGVTPVGRINYGTLLSLDAVPDRPLTAVEGGALSTGILRRHWTLLVADVARCGDVCQRKLYATRQARTMQGKERERVIRVWMVTDGGTPPPALLVEHPDLVVARADDAVLRAIGDTPPADGIWLIDPLGNPVLRYPSNPDIKGIHRDLGRLLAASRIG